MGFTVGMHGFFYIFKSNTVICHANELNDKNQMIISVDAEEVFDKIKYPLR